MVNWANIIHQFIKLDQTKGREAYHIEQGKILEPLGIIR